MEPKNESNTRERILDAAEQIFATRGVDGASMRAITALAKVNLSVVYYYFKDKEALLFAVFDRHVKPLIDRQLEILRQARELAGTAPIPPRRLAEAMILPHAECVSESVHRLFTMILLRSGELERRVFASLEHAARELRDCFLREFGKTFPELSSVELSFRIESVRAMLAGWTTIAPCKKGTYPKQVKQEHFFEMFMAMVLEMFNAPPTLSLKS